jgi:hypothetical protein
MDEIELTERENEPEPTGEKLISSPKIDGINKQVMYDRLLHADPPQSIDTINHIFSNAYKAITYFSNPDYPGQDNVLSKILCLGKVQSGKTAFFTAAVALAFDNGYNLAYLIGGTKTKLKNQNFSRIDLEFSNNQKVKVHELDPDFSDDVEKEISEGYQVIIVLLKNPSENVNLGALSKLVAAHKDIPTIIIDDEGDEFTPGAPKSKAKNGRAGRTHDVISQIIYTPRICTYLSVTATPQANFLISTIDQVSPDYAVLVQPGQGYTGGNAFHDVMENPHTVGIADSDDFQNSVPNSFLAALYFFLFAACLKRSQGMTQPFSMLVHPSYLTSVQTMVVSKVADCYSSIKKILSDPSGLSYSSALDRLREQSEEYKKMNPGVQIDFSSISLQIPFVLNQVCLIELNVSPTGQVGIALDETDKSLYKIYVGGNMLGRGLTIKNLIVTYIYRDSKVTAIDTLYQRARWFGYKKDYFDVCRVYMTEELKRKFIVTVDNENDLWASMEAYLMTKTRIKFFPRLFSLPDDTGKMILTRRSISKTVVLQRINPGYQYDKSICLSEKEIADNRILYHKYFEFHSKDGRPENFSSSGSQVHFVIETSFTEFYKNFLVGYHFPRGSVFGLLGFQKILAQINSGKYDDKLAVVIMRYETGEYRSAIENGGVKTNIKELPQGYDNKSGYGGDKDLPGFVDRAHFQIHLVFTEKDHPEDTIPILAFNNPISAKSITYVTGDNVYDGI